MQNLHHRATLDGNRIEPPPAPLPDPDVVFDHLVSMAALARALKPDLPEHIRFVRYAPLDEEERNTASFKVMFTSDVTPLADGGYQDVNARELWEVMEEVLPKDMVQAEQDNLATSPRFRFASPADAAVYSAFKRERLSIETKVLDEDRVLQVSGAVRPAELAFLSTPSLARWIYLAPVVGNEEQIAPNIASLRRDVHLLRDNLARDYQDCSASDRDAVKQALSRLSSRKAGNFEIEQQHGWIGYSLAQGAEGWTGFLLANGADPHMAYQSNNPIVWALANDDHKSVQALCDAGAPATSLMTSTPRVYKGPEQRELSSRLGGGYSSLLGFAAACGATRSMATLLDEGAEIDGLNSNGATAAHILAASGNEPGMRLLMARGARLDIEDSAGNLACQYVPENQDSLFDTMETVRLGAVPELKPASIGEYRDANGKDAYGQEPSIWDEVTTPPRSRKR